MRGTLAALIAGVILGSSGVALASGTINPWKHTTPSYTCYGYQGAAWCRLRGTPYNSFVQPRHIGIYFRGEPIFTCERGRYSNDPYDDCIDYR